MGLHAFSDYKVQTLTAEGWETNGVQGAGLFTLMESISGTGLKHTISITDASAADASLPAQGMKGDFPHSDQFSLWARYGIFWRYVVIGAVNIDDIALELVDAIKDNNADELRICPPGCPEPRKLS